MAVWKGHVRSDVSAKGYFRFRKTLVEYAHDGIAKLRYRIPLPQCAWQLEQTSGTFTTAYSFDSGTGRTPLVLTCSSAGVYKARLRFQLPPDFGSFTAQGLDIFTQRNAAITHLKLTLLKAAAADAGVNGVSISPSSTGVWQAFQFSPSGAYSKRDWLTLVVEFSADTAADEVKIADVGIEYLSARGYAT